MMALLVLLVVVALAANYGPLSHYMQARERLQETTARVEALQQQAAGLQAQLGKLSESGYLEDLAREQLTYALPGEDLYIVKQPEDAAGGEVSATESESQPAETTATTAGGASAAQTSVGADAPSGADVAGALETSGEQARLPQPGFFERVLMAIAALF
jgi:cell division protein FtsB